MQESESDVTGGHGHTLFSLSEVDIDQAEVV